MKRRLLNLSLILATLFISCEKNQSGSTGQVTNMSDLKIPEGFTWENSKDISFNIKITDTRFGNKVHVVSIYDADPATGGKLLSKGSGSTDQSFETKIYIPNTIKEVFVVKIAPDNSQSVTKVSISGSNLSMELSSVSKFDSGLQSNNKTSGISDSPDCTTGCTQTVTTSNTNLNVNAGTVLCITGNNITVGFNANGGTIRICGTNVTVQNAALSNNTTLIVTSTASVNFASLNLNGTGVVFKNYGVTTVNGSLAPMGVFLNENTLSCTGDFNGNTTSEFTNNGVMNVGATFNLNSNSTAYNNGSITTTSHFQLNSDTEFVNNCFIWAKGNYNHNNDAVMKNYGLIKVNETTNVNGNRGEVGMYAGSMLSTKHFVLNNVIKGYGGPSLVKVSSNTTINSGTLTGPLQFCDLNGIETSNRADWENGASQACGLYIATSNCNTEGNGTAPVGDADNDGVADNQDEYPNDPTKAYNNYYPSASPSQGATVAFEDQWPIKGDYDLNDVVVSYRYKVVTNAANKVVQVVGNYTLHATGSGYRTGFGVEFPLASNRVTSVTGGTRETGQTNVVVTLFDDIRDEMTEWNTIREKPLSPTKNYEISFNVSNGPTLSSFGLGSYNPFIWDGGKGDGRNHEIHLPGKKPTSKGTTSLFGTGDDNSSVSAARYYVTQTGLPWAIDIPIKPFNYPVEYINITGGYLKFQSWAESGGTSFPDWYSNTGSGYRNNTNLFLP